MSNSRLCPDLTLGVSSNGNHQALLLCLSNALNASVQPSAVQVRLEGADHGLDRFYLEQVTELGRHSGIPVSFHIFKSTGVRDTRDWQLSHCRTKYLWMLDDDVIPDWRCLEAFVHSRSRPEVESKNYAFFAGSKPDLNNRRNYPGFSQKVIRRKEVAPCENHSLVYDIDDCWAWSQPTRVFDTGNVIFDVSAIRAKGCKFRIFNDGGNSSGDATTFSLVLDKAGLKGVFCPSAVALHLEKEKGGFNEFEARKEMLYRLCDSQGFDKTILDQYFMPHLVKI